MSHIPVTSGMWLIHFCVVRNSVSLVHLVMTHLHRNGWVTYQWRPIQCHWYTWSWLIYICVRTHSYLCHGSCMPGCMPTIKSFTQMNEWCNTYTSVASHIWMSHATHMDESYHTCRWVMAHMWISRATRVNNIHKSWHKYEYVTYLGACVTRLNHMCDMTHAHMWHAKRVTWPVHTCDMTHSYLGACQQWVHTSAVCSTAARHVARLCMLWHDSFICCYMTHAYIMTWRIHML